MSVRKKTIIAMDFASAEGALECARKLKGTATYLKVGMQLYYAAGPQIVAAFKEQGFKVFVDLKVHDIPNTAKGAMESLAALGADMVNVHAAGGKEMMIAAKEGLQKGGAASGQEPLLIAVTQLTSTTVDVMNREIGVAGSIEDCVRNYSLTAREAGLDGVVASPLEVKLIKKATGVDFLTVTPGIRPAGSAAGDQKRVTTPKMAFDLGTDFIVVGRPITGAADPAQALEDLIGSVEHG